jgi:3'-phosphoadenosine 5'-phosphosulfate sulfotransferase (PAPS reductase)/FAD synthetase
VRQRQRSFSLYEPKKNNDVNIEYYTCDTGKELTETYDLIDKLNSVLKTLNLQINGRGELTRKEPI